ncbi:conserved hypothetical protein, partial [Candida albicans WO-1]
KCTISPPPPLPLYDLLYLLLSSSQPNSIYLYIQIWGFSQNFTIPFFKLYTEIQPTESINVSNNQNKLSLICPTVNKKKRKIFLESFFRTCATTHLLFSYCIYVIKKEILILDIEFLVFLPFIIRKWTTGTKYNFYTGKTGG